MDTSSDSEFSYRELHEAFVSNHTGTTPWEIFLNLTTSVGGFFIIHLLKHVQYSWMKIMPVQFLLEFVVIVIPQMWTLTHGCDYADMIVVTMLIIIVTLHLPDKQQEIRKQDMIRYKRKYSEQHVLPLNSQYYTFVSNYRVLLFLSTSMCILAVDFPIFPRRFAKAETYGFGLMDVGVGTFIFANASVSPEAKNIFRPERRIAQLKKNFVSSLPLIILGFGRLISTSSIEYQSHESEYGLHWNYFFTLAATKVLSSIIFTCFPVGASGFLAVLFSIGYQIFLHLGLRSFALLGSDGQGTREGLLNANREGLVSCIGYLCLYLAGVSLFRFVYNTGPCLQFWMHKVMLLGILLVIFSSVTWVSHFYIEEVSRRLANLTYILWMITFQIYFLCLFLIVDLLLVIFELKRMKNWKDSISFPPLTLLADAIQYNALGFFLLSNLLTGFVNLTVPTIKTTSPTAFLILISYMFTLCLTAIVLRYKNVRLKCW